jgi:hypothetical protein
MAALGLISLETFSGYRIVVTDMNRWEPQIKLPSALFLISNLTAIIWAGFEDLSNFMAVTAPSVEP